MLVPGKVLGSGIIDFLILAYMPAWYLFLAQIFYFSFFVYLLMDNYEIL